MKKLLLSIIAVAGFYTSSCAQAGYLGKTFMAGYNVRTLSTIIFRSSNANAFNGSENYEFTMGGLNLMHSLTGDFIFSNKSMIGLEYGFEFLTANFQDINQSKLLPLNVYYPVRYVGNTIGLNFTTYGLSSEAAPAPIGNYIRIKYFRTFANVIDTKGFTNVEDRSWNSGAMVPEKELDLSYTIDAFGFGYGHTRVISDVVVLDIGLELNYYYTDPMDNATPELMEASNTVDVFHYYAISNHFLNFRLGLSGLLF